MMVYIDGYNLLFRILKVEEELKLEREKLVKDLEKKINLLDLDVSIVFDSQYQPDEGSISHLKHLEVVFTAQGETADEYILKKIKEAAHPSQIQVVTSDKKLATLCRRKLARVAGVDEFMEMLNRRVKNKLSPRKHAPPQHVAKPPSQLPSRLAAPEECLDYYLEIFQKEFEESYIPPPPPPKEAKKRAKPKLPEEPAPPMTDMERWQQAFERGLNRDLDDGQL